MKNLQSLLPALIIALAVLGGLLGGAKIIFSEVVEANRFQFVEAHGESPKFFDTATGAVYYFNFSDDVWQTQYDWTHSNIEIGNADDWSLYLEYVRGNAQR